MTVDTFEFHRYEVGIIINNNRTTIMTTNDLTEANYWYELYVNKYNGETNINHNIVFIYDYDKNTNINYYDSRVDVC